MGETMDDAIARREELEEENDRLRAEAEEFAGFVLNLLVLDMEYRHNLRPFNGHAPIRHQLPWLMAEEVLGERFEPEVKRRESLLESGVEEPVNRNPRLNGE